GRGCSLEATPVARAESPLERLARVGETVDESPRLLGPLRDRELRDEQLLALAQQRVELARVQADRLGSRERLLRRPLLGRRNGLVLDLVPALLDRELDVSRQLARLRRILAASHQSGDAGDRGLEARDERGRETWARASARAQHELARLADRLDVQSAHRACGALQRVHGAKRRLGRLSRPPRRKALLEREQAARQRGEVLLGLDPEGGEQPRLEVVIPARHSSLSSRARPSGDPVTSSLSLCASSLTSRAACSTWRVAAMFWVAAWRMLSMANATCSIPAVCC